MSGKISIFVRWIALQRRWLLMWAVLFIASIGCEQSARNLTVDKSTARQALTSFLTAWKDGKKSTELEPKIVGKDSDWNPANTLQSFEVLPEERSDGANLYMKVLRTIKTEKGAAVKEEVGYVVSTSPFITVFRSDQ